MQTNEFARQARVFMHTAYQEIWDYREVDCVAVIQGLIETLLLLVEEYEGVLDEYHDPSVPAG